MPYPAYAGFQLAAPGVPGAFGYGGGWALGGGYVPSFSLGGVGSWLSHAIGPTVSTGKATLAAGASVGKAALAATLSGAVIVGGAVLVVLLTPSAAGDLTITSVGTSGPLASPPLPVSTTTSTSTATITTYSSSSDGDPAYHIWNNILGVAQALYLANVPNGDRIIWPYLSTGWVGYANSISQIPFDGGGFMWKGGSPFLAAGLNSWDSFQHWFGKIFPSDWTDLGLVWTPDMMSFDDPRHDDRWKWDGYGWLHQLQRHDPDRGPWYDGGIHPDFQDRMYALGNFAHSLAQKGTFYNALGELRKTFTNIYEGLTLVIKFNRYFDVWNSKQLADFTWGRTAGVSANPYEAVPILVLEKPTAEEFVLWEPNLAKPDKKVASISLTKTKTKMKCCPLVLKQLKKIRKTLREYLEHDIKGHFPPICLEEGTKHPVTGEPIVDWNNPKAVKILETMAASGIAGIKVEEVYAGKGLAGIAEMIRAQTFQQSQTALGTGRGRGWWCEVETPKTVEQVVKSGITDTSAIALPDNVLSVIVEIEKFEKHALRRYHHEGLWLKPPFPKSGWFGFISFVTDAHRASPKIAIGDSNMIFGLPFPSKWIILRLEPFVTARVLVMKIKTP